MFRDKKTGQMVFSPSDLTTFWQSEFASWMDRLAVEVPETASEPDPDDVLMKTLQEKGYKHEDAEIERLISEGRQVTKISTSDQARAREDTIAAMRRGDDVIFQARLELGSFAGWADFLVRVDGESELGDYHYEVYDTKLAGKLKGYFVIQLCAYVEMLAAIQGRKADKIYVVLGTGQRKSLATMEYFGYYEAIRDQFLDFHRQWDKDQRPDPERYRDFGRWKGHAEDVLRSQDSLSQLARITSLQVKNLNAAGIKTIQDLIDTTEVKVPKMSVQVFQRLKHQARLQKASEGQEVPQFEIIDHNTIPHDHGLKRLPALSSNDVYFDIEGYPLIEGGLEYLWGNVYRDGDKIAFKDFWAHNQEQEKEAFQSFIDWIWQRWQDDPTMHVYHYAQYEITALHKLSTRYRIKEYEVDTLLNRGVFIDLYQIVKQALVIGSPSYSIKYVEHLYRGRRKNEVADGATSVVYYDAWRHCKDGETWQDSDRLRELRDYNIDDCESTLELTEWLRDLQLKEGIEPFFATFNEESGEKLEAKQEIDAIVSKLEALGTAEAQLLSDLIGFYRREEKPKWWSYFHRMGLTEVDLEKDIECLTDLRLLPEEVVQVGRQQPSYGYRFDNTKDCKLEKNQDGRVHHNKDIKVKMTDIDYGRGIAWFQFRKGDIPPERFAFIPLDADLSRSLQESLLRFVKGWLAGDLKNHAVSCFLAKDLPHLKEHDAASILAEGGSLQDMIDVVRRMDHTCLTIQGPPGAGKTFTASHLIAALVRDGQTVGVTSNSHKAINHLLAKISEVLDEQGIDTTITKVAKNKEDDVFSISRIKQVNTGKDVVLNEQCQIVGGTSWTFAKDTLEGAFDYLFVDEAGQVSLAKLVSMALSSRNFVFLGDQMQLSQPIQGNHPGQSGMSILDYLLEDHATIPPDQGIFLDRTFRMHPDICRFISERIYEGRLAPSSETEKRVFKNLAGLELPNSGIAYVPVMHEGNSQASDEEVYVIKELTQNLLGQEIYDGDGRTKALALKDILYVTPYNMQVRKLQEALGEEARIGSVDRFQGQEAAVVILSMCASNASSGRGVEFLFDKNRMNVALSRAQTLAIVVGHPDLATTFTTDIEKMALVNLYGLLINYAKCVEIKPKTSKKEVG